MMPALDLVPIWTTILAIGVFFYVALDGFDLGVGMLYNFAPDRRSRDLLMNSIAPIWDGNETWLVLGGALGNAPGVRAAGKFSSCLPTQS